MDTLKHLNDAIAFIESNLCEKVDMGRLAQIACLAQDSFVRFFSYITGMTLAEYIRCRRLTLAAYELRNSNSKVIDVAIKYGWNSADAFTKAFVRQHGITPTEARNQNTALKIYPPASFYIMIKGAKEMDFRIEKVEATEVYGISKRFDDQEFKTKEELRHIMWSEDCDFVPGKICDGYDGIWYGIWGNNKYFIARNKEDVKNGNLEKHIIPAGTYAVFKTERGGFAWEELPKLKELIIDSWLPDSEYKQKGDFVMEVYHLWTNREERKNNRYYEIWINIEKKQFEDIGNI